MQFEVSQRMEILIINRFYRKLAKGKCVKRKINAQLRIVQNKLRKHTKIYVLDTFLKKKIIVPGKVVSVMK